MSGNETRAADGVLTPTDVGKRAVRVVTAGAAQIVDLQATWGSYPAASDAEARTQNKSAYFSIRPIGGDIYVRFRTRPAPGASALTPATSATNGWPIKDGEIANFFVEPYNNMIDLFGAGSVYIYESSEEF